MKISDTRRARLREWLETHTMPPKEKSYFSQLANGAASFGEKAARRIERQYGMGEGYLDLPLPSEWRDAAVGSQDKATDDTTQGSDETASAQILRLLPQLTETQKTEIANTMQGMADKNTRLLAELLARDAQGDQVTRRKGKGS